MNRIDPIGVLSIMSILRTQALVGPMTLLAAAILAVGCGGSDNGSPGDTNDVPVVALHKVSETVPPGTSLSEPRATISGCSDGVRNVVDANNAFGFGLLRSIDTNSEKKNINTVLSPFSAAHAIQLLANGSLDAKTEREALDALCASGLSLDDVNRLNGDLHRDLEKTEEGVDLQVANSLWTEQSFTASPAMVDVARTFYDSDLFTFDVDETEESAARINSWADKHTKGFIKHVINPDEIPSPDGPRVMFLINAIVFDGTWTQTFDKRDTRPWTFHAPDGAELKHDFLHMTTDLEYWHDKKLKVGAVRLPYGEDERFRMIVILPDEKQPVEVVRDALSPKVWSRWNSKYESMTVAFSMPKVKLSNQYDLLSLFTKKPGIPQGSYGRLVDPVYPDTHVDYAKQDTFLEIDEKGTKAAAVTVIGTGGLAGGVSGVPFTVDRPYLLALEDSKTGSILFTALIRTPAGKK